MTTATSAGDWFLKAQRAYGEQHQGCAWCGGEHRVRMSRQGAKHIYACQHCDFQVSYDAEADRFHCVPGEQQSTAMETMLEHPIADLL